MTYVTGRIYKLIVCMFCISSLSLEIWAESKIFHSSRNNMHRKRTDLGYAAIMDLLTSAGLTKSDQSNSIVKSEHTNGDLEPSLDCVTESQEGDQPEGDDLPDYLLSASRVRCAPVRNQVASESRFDFEKRKGRAMSMSMPLRMTAAYMDDLARRRDYNAKYFDALTSLAEIGRK